MAQNKAKKQWRSALFDFDRVKAQMEKESTFLSDVREHLAALQKIDLKQLSEASVYALCSPTRSV